MFGVEALLYFLYQSQNTYNQHIYYHLTAEDGMSPALRALVIIAILAMAAINVHGTIRTLEKQEALVAELSAIKANEVSRGLH